MMAFWSWYSSNYHLQKVPERTNMTNTTLRQERIGTNHPWRDPFLLEELYWEEGLSERKIADELGCHRSTIRRWMDDYDIDRRGRIEALRAIHAGFYTTTTGYEQWQASDGREDVDVFGVHRLLAIAEFGTDAVAGSHIHHKNGIPWDNRVGNLEVLTPSEHNATHHDQRWGDSPWRDKETLEQLYVKERLPREDIAERLGCNNATVGEWIEKYGIERDRVACGHSGIVNLGEGVYTCSNSDCDAEYTRDEIEEVLG